MRTEETPTLKVGNVYEVGEFFWPEESLCIGFAPDAQHEHGLSFGGSVYRGDRVLILGFEGEMAVVKLLKQRVPCGAPAPHGLIFMLPQNKILSWPCKIARDRDAEKRRAELLSRYGRPLANGTADYTDSFWQWKG